ncbi:MAG: 6,7-dimethyl-8-ribityllumazine synthase [Phycisphaeraceae bacterium]|nr:6,7-dimethyl-8-ribityllumazine synthase [Phycisphaeraceae bacterium]
MHKDPATSLSEQAFNARGLRIGVVTSAYHAEITAKLEEGAVEAFIACGGESASLRRVASPGAFELVPIAAALAERDDIDGVVVLGCIVRGETRHDRVLGLSVAQALAHLAATQVKPVTFGVLTVDRLRQARERCGGAHGHKGREAMVAAIAAVRAIQAVRA